MDAQSDSTEIVSQSSGSSGLYQVNLYLPGLWGPIRLYREANLDHDLLSIKWLQDHRLIYQRMDCRRHRRPRTWYSRTDGHFSWYCSGCNDRISIFKDSIFDDSRISHQKLLLLILCFANRCTYEETKRNLIFDGESGGITNQTISHWFDIFRDLLVDTLDQDNPDSKIGGPGKVVQVDEALIGRRKYNRGRLVPGTWVVGLIDEEGDIRLQVTNQRDANSLQDIIQRHVHQGSIIHTDGWRAYIGIANHGYHHRTVNHSEEFVAEDGTHTQRIEAQWRALRRYFSPGGRRHEDIPTILAEYTWRRKCIVQNAEPFVQFLKIIQIQ